MTNMQKFLTPYEYDPSPTALLHYCDNLDDSPEAKVFADGIRFAAYVLNNDERLNSIIEQYALDEDEDL